MNIYIQGCTCLHSRLYPIHSSPSLVHCTLSPRYHQGFTPVPQRTLYSYITFSRMLSLTTLFTTATQHQYLYLPPTLPACLLSFIFSPQHLPSSSLLYIFIVYLTLSVFASQTATSNEGRYFLLSLDSRSLWISRTQNKTCIQQVLFKILLDESLHYSNCKTVRGKAIPGLTQMSHASSSLPLQ